MDARTLKALARSIRKWRRISEGSESDKGDINCALCQTFPNCCGCPIAYDTGLSACRNTPWVKWGRSANYILAADDSGAYFWRRTADTPKQQMLALEMYGYLLSLWPEGVPYPRGC